MIGDTAAAALGGGRYELGAVLGTGGMAQVRSATDTVLGRPVAVKLFRADLDQDSAARARTEMQTLASLAHPGLVGVYDAGTELDATGTPQPFLVMELVEGPTLAACCLDGSLTPERLIEVGGGLADALQYVHDRGVVHRDVKPANILLSPSGVKLADFGIARIVDGARHTGTGLTIGTAPYLSPEQVTGAEVGPAADVYALGLVLLECFTGRREYTGGPVETAMARLHRQPVIPDSLPAPWPELLTVMTAREAGDRPTAGEVADVLRGGALPAAQPTAAPVQATTVLDTGDSATRVLDGPAVAVGDPGTSVLDSGPADGPSTGQTRARVVPRVVPREPPHPGRGPAPQVVVELLGRTAVQVGLGVLALLLIVLAIGASGSAAPASKPVTPTSPLEQHIADLDKAVTR